MAGVGSLAVDIKALEHAEYEWTQGVAQVKRDTTRCAQIRACTFCVKMASYNEPSNRIHWNSLTWRFIETVHVVFFSLFLSLSLPPPSLSRDAELWASNDILHSWCVQWSWGARILPSNSNCTCLLGRGIFMYKHVYQLYCHELPGTILSIYFPHELCVCVCVSEWACACACCICRRVCVHACVQL